jgi:hypothetical protein
MTWHYSHKRRTGPVLEPDLKGQCCCTLFLGGGGGFRGHNNLSVSLTYDGIIDAPKKDILKYHKNVGYSAYSNIEIEISYV